MPQNETNHTSGAVEYLTTAFPELTEGENQVATVVRYAQRMGFDGYTSFRLHPAQKCSSDSDVVLDFPRADGSVEDRGSRMLRANIESMRLTLEEMYFASLIAAGKIAFAESDFCRAALLLSGMRESDLLVAVSHSGRSGETLRVLRCAKAAGIRTVGITTLAGTEFAESADLTLFTKTRESPLHNVAISSRISQFAVLDALYMAYMTARLRVLRRQQRASRGLHAPARASVSGALQ